MSNTFWNMLSQDDTMLNNILGPVAFFNLKNGEIHLIRYNEQFFELIGLNMARLGDQASCRIQNSFYSGDREKFLQMLEEATHDRMNGSKGILRYCRPDGFMLWISFQVYFTQEDESGRKFYVAARNVTDLQYINPDIPGGYFQCTTDDGFRFLQISMNFQNLTGFTENEIQVLFNNRLINMVHPMDRELLLEEAEQNIHGQYEKFKPYRLRTRGGGYIYVAEQSRLSHQFGSLCWQSVVTDVTEVVKIRHQMRILSEYYKDNILFLQQREDTLVYEAVVYGLQDTLGLDKAEFLQLLNNGEFCHWIDGYTGDDHDEATRYLVEVSLEREKTLTVHVPGGTTFPLSVRTWSADDPQTDVVYIMVIRVVE